MEDKQKIVELREKFFKKLEEEGPPDNREFHPLDINRVKSGDDWLRRFLEHTEYNLQESLKMLWDTCTWRRNFGTNDISESTVRRDYLEEGVCFGYGQDKDGKKLFVIKSKLHTKNARDFPELQRCIVYWFERLERESNGDQITLFFDMIDAGLGNVDMELTSYLIDLFKNYYPYFLNYILILEMGWLLNATFNIIKSWLPAKAIPKIKFLKKSNLKDYVHPDVALKCWGGNNDYVFTFVPEVQNESLANGKLENRKVHFAGNSPITEQAATNFGEQLKSEDHMLSVEPDILTFNKSGNAVIGTITLKNTVVDKNLSYKIKTTSPEKFKVRPNTGILLASQKVTVTITLQPGYNSRALIPNDRFLIMCLPIKDSKLSNQELIDFWKNNTSSPEEHKLICRDGTEGLDGFKTSSPYYSSGGIGGDHSINSLFAKISHIEEEQIKVQKDVKRIKQLLLICMSLVIVFLIYISYSLNGNLTLKSQICHTSEAIHDEI